MTDSIPPVITEEIPGGNSASETPQGNILLSVQDLRVWFELRRFGFGHAGFVHAVDGVSFDLYEGEAIAIVGESGCGKSSLMKTILGLNKITQGQITFKGKSLAAMKSDELRTYRSNVGYVQQDPYGAMAPFMSVQRILEEPLKINTSLEVEDRLKRIERALTEVKVTPVQDFLPKFPHMLSGGQQQRPAAGGLELLQEARAAFGEGAQVFVVTADGKIRIHAFSSFAADSWRRNASRRSGVPTSTHRPSWRSPLTLLSRIAVRKSGASGARLPAGSGRKSSAR